MQNKNHIWLCCFCQMSDFLHPPLFSKSFSVAFFFKLTCLFFTVPHSSTITITKALRGKLSHFKLVTRHPFHRMWLFLQRPGRSYPQHCSKHITPFHWASAGECTATRFTSTSLLVNCKSLIFLLCK